MSIPSKYKSKTPNGYCCLSSIQERYSWGDLLLPAINSVVYIETVIFQVSSPHRAVDVLSE